MQFGIVEYNSTGAAAEGRAKFERRPDGQWIISDWMMLAPLPPPGKDGVVLKSRKDSGSIIMKEVGGTVLGQVDPK
jgi:hypothetical protein